jgi:chromosome segregation ATPase
MALTPSQKSQIESKKDQIESKKRNIESLKNTVNNNKEHLRSLIKSTKDKATKESYKRRLADSHEYTKKHIEQIKESIQDLKEDIIRIKQG